MLMGKDSGVEREIDIVVRQHTGQYELFVAIDCKDYKRRVDVKAVEAFLGLVADVGAHKGAMVASKGFTGAAKTRARNAGIDLYSLIDAQEHEWQSYVTIPMVVEDTSIDHYSLTFSTTKQFRLRPQDFRELVLYRADGSEIGVVRELVARAWEDEAIPQTPGEHRGVPLSPDATHVMTGGVLYSLDVRANVHVSRTLYFGHLPLSEVQGFSDELDGGLITKSFTTAALVYADMHKEWQVIASLRDLAITPLLTLCVSTSYLDSQEDGGPDGS